MDLDPVFLSRLQFAWVIGWHILLPAFTVGLASFIAVLEGVFLWRGDAVYARVSTFWIRIFSVSGVDRTWGSCSASVVCDRQATVEDGGPCDGNSVSALWRPPHPSALSYPGIDNVIY